MAMFILGVFVGIAASIFTLSLAKSAGEEDERRGMKWRKLLIVKSKLYVNT